MAGSSGRARGGPIGSSVNPDLLASVRPPGLRLDRGGLQCLALGDTRVMEALEAPVLHVELVAHPDEQVVERVASVAERQTLDGFQIAAPFAVEPGEIILVEDDG